MMADKTVPKRKKILIVLGLVYLFMPIDLVPAVIFPIAWMDDVVLWIWILWTLKDELDKYWLGEKTEDLSKKYKSKEVIDIEDAEYEVDIDDDNKES